MAKPGPTAHAPALSFIGDRPVQKSPHPFARFALPEMFLMSLVGDIFLIPGSLLMLGGALDERLHRLERALRYLPREYAEAHHRPEHGAPHDPAIVPQAGAAAGRLLPAVRANLDKPGVPAQARYDSQSESDGGTDVRFEVWCHLTNLAVDQPADPTV